MKEKISKEMKEKITQTLSEKGVKKCPMCENRSFTLLDGYSNLPIAGDISGALIVGGQVIPSTVIVCTNCGYISQHALGIMGLLPKKDVEEEASGK